VGDDGAHDVMNLRYFRIVEGVATDSHTPPQLHRL
jgi:hypothetical protein